MRVYYTYVMYVVYWMS